MIGKVHPGISRRNFLKPFPGHRFSNLGQIHARHIGISQQILTAEKTENKEGIQPLEVKGDGIRTPNPSLRREKSNHDTESVSLKILEGTAK